MADLTYVSTWSGWADVTFVIGPRGPWRNRDDLEYATVEWIEWVDWCNHRRLYTEWTTSRVADRCCRDSSQAPQATTSAPMSHPATTSVNQCTPR